MFEQIPRGPKPLLEEGKTKPTQTLLKLIGKKPMAEGQCDICGETVKNLGLHKYQKHRDKSVQAVQQVETIKVDIPEKPLSELLSEVKTIFARYRHFIKTEIAEESGKTKEITLTVRIQL